MKNVAFKEWLKAAGIRAVRTVAQTALATIGTAAVTVDIYMLTPPDNLPMFTS